MPASACGPHAAAPGRKARRQAWQNDHMTHPQQPSSPQQQTGLLPAFKDNFPGETPRMLFVHAHPDDESITTGATMAGYAAAGADVVLLTCTRGELGEVIPPELAHLQAGTPASRDNGEELAHVRTAELAEAAAALGVSARYFLGEGAACDPELDSAHYRDSGMAWAQSGRAQAGETLDPASFVAAELSESGHHIAQLIRTLRPHVVVTYDADGGYGHPDHIRTHEATQEGLQLAAAEAGAGGAQAWAVPWVYSIRSAGDGAIAAGSRPVIRIPGDLERKRAAMGAHVTQLVLDGDRFALSNGVWQPLTGEEFFLREDAAAFLPGAGKPADVGGDGRQRNRSVAVPSRAAALGGAGLAALIAAICGTALHGQILYGTSFALPWGAVAALILVASVTVAVGVWARNVWMTILTGLLTYVLVALFVSTGSQLIITGVAGPATPPIVLAGMIWIIGIGVATVVAAVICLASLRRPHIV